jgi:CRISPR-associated endoribonuclease Cas6
MQMTFSFKSTRDLILPIQYNHILQGFIYNSIDPDLAQFLHNQGFLVDNRAFRLFVFSRLLGDFVIDKPDQKIHFGHDFRLLVASPLEIFCRSLCSSMLSTKSLVLGGTLIDNLEVNITEPKAEGDCMVVYSRSPITAYSTLLRPDGRKYTCYFQPGENEFNELVSANLKKKYEAIFQRTPPEGNVRVLPVSQHKFNIINYKDTIIKGSSGKFKLTGPVELLQMALDAGLGSKNAQGFGFVELSSRRQ